MNELVNPEIKKFTKEQSQVERDTLAKEIKEKRKEYFERKRSISEEIKELEGKTVNQELGVEEQRKKIEAIEEKIAQKKSSKIAELINFFELRSLRKKLETEVTTKESIEDDYLKIKQLLESLNESVNDKYELDEARNKLTEFYGGKRVEWNEYLKDQKVRNIANIAEKYNANFIHAIHPNFIPGSNSPLQENVDWKTKLKILMALEPSISTSTIQQGDDWQKMWARMGLILNGGYVNSASSGDQASIPTGLKGRPSRASFGNENIKDDIDHAITYKNRGYNELTVDNPEIAGFYICFDDTGSIVKDDLVPVEEIAETLSEYQMPIYAIMQGVVFETEYDEKAQTLKVKNRISPTELLDKQFKLDDTQRTKIKEELFADSPFKINAAEMCKVDSRAQGRQTYIEINFWHGTNKNLANNPSLAEFPKIGAKVKYSIESEKLTMSEMNTRTGKKNPWGGEVWDRYSFDNGWIRIGYNTMQLGHPVDSNGAYLSGMEKVLKEWKRNVEGYANKNDRQGLKLSQDILNRIIFHLYGFAEQAEEMGDSETQTKAAELAKQYLSYEEYSNTIQRRIDNDGKLKITEEDLRSFR